METRRGFVLKMSSSALAAATGLFASIEQHAKAAANRIADRRDEKAKAVDALFNRWSADRGTPGAAVRVVWHDEVLLAREYGLARIRRPRQSMTPQTRFLLASLTKPFTALAVMMLVEQGELSYESRLTEFFPQFRSYARAITIRHLLWHTAGLREFDELFDLEGKLDTDFPRSASLPPSEYEPTSADTLALLARHSKLSPAGEKYKYSNSAYVVLGQIVERVSGQSYPDFIQRRIFAPAGMRHSSVPVEKWRDVPHRATSYKLDGEKFRDVDYTPLNLVYGEDGIYTTADDLVRWSTALYTGKFAKQSTLDEAFRSGKTNDGQATDYGYGWVIAPDHFWHNGAWEGFDTYFAQYRDLRFAVIVLANCSDLDATLMGEEIASIYLEG